MAKKASALAGIFDDAPANAPAPPIAPGVTQRAARPNAKTDGGGSHPGKKPVLIHIPADMHRVLRQLSVEPDGEPLTRITERALRQYLVQRGHAKFAE